MYEHYTGKRILNVNPDTTGNRTSRGKSGIVKTVTSNTVYVRYDDGTTGHSDNPERYYRITGDAPKACQSKEGMNNVISFFKNLTVSSDDKLLREYDLQDEAGNFTDTAHELVQAKLVADSKAFLVETAKAFKAEKKANKKDSE